MYKINKLYSNIYNPCLLCHKILCISYTLVRIYYTASIYKTFVIIKPHHYCLCAQHLILVMGNLFFFRKLLEKLQWVTSDPHLEASVLVWDQVRVNSLAWYFDAKPNLNDVNYQLNNNNNHLRDDWGAKNSHTIWVFCHHKPCWV